LEALSEFNPQQPVQKVIMNDQRDVIDQAVATELKTTKLKYVSTGPTAGTFTANGTPSGTATDQFNFFHLKQMVDAAKMGVFGSDTGKIIPPMADGNYVLILTVKAARGLYDDPEYQEAAKFSYPRKLFNGEISQEIAYHTRIVHTDNELALSNVAGSNDIGEALLIGDDSVIEGIALKEELRYKLAVKYGRDHGLAWYGIFGFKKPWDFVADGEEHVIHYTSA
jgi:hypothetical protein